jgi:fumarate hydratase class II
MSATRTETDSIGAIEVPADAYWGAQTQRSIENFPFGATERMPIGIVHAQAIVKQAAARVKGPSRLKNERVETIFVSFRNFGASFHNEPVSILFCPFLPIRQCFKICFII